MTSIAFTNDGRIMAVHRGAPRQVGAMCLDVRGEDGGTPGWTAVLWRYPDTAPVAPRDGRTAGLRFAGSRKRLEARVEAKFRADGPWWTAGGEPAKTEEA